MVSNWSIVHFILVKAGIYVEPMRRKRIYAICSGSSSGQHPIYVEKCKRYTNRKVQSGNFHSQIRNVFSFFSELKSIASDALKNRCEQLANMYHNDLNYDNLLNECEHLKNYMALDENCETFPALYRKIISDNLKSVFPNVEFALRVFKCMMVTNCTKERSFSRLKLIKKSAS